MMTYVKKIIMAMALLSVFASCEPGSVPTSFVDLDNSGRTTMSLSLESGTKSSLLAGSESVSSGANAYVFYHDTGKLDSVQNIDASGTATITVPSGRTIDVLVLGNLWAVNTGDGSVGSVFEALGADFPSDRSAVESLTYLLDGGPISSSWRRETLAEVASYGLPFSGRVENFTATPGMSLPVLCTRLFSKVSLTVDHTGLDGGKDAGWFRNVKLYLRQANGRLAPFSTEPQRAMSAADVIEGDYDPAMETGHSMTFTFYVPENMQGTLLPGNTDQSAKSLAQVSAAVGDERAGLLTYVEFSGTINSAPGGYGGDVVYRFYLGSDSVSNFDLERGRDYDVTLGMRVDSIFDPWWQVNSESVVDTRLFCLTKDASFSSTLPDAQMVAVRKSRPGKVYVYMNRDGSAGSTNALLGRAVAGSSYAASDLSECAWTSDFLSGGGSSDTPRRADLDAMGITPSYDSSTGLLTFSVTDASKFSPGSESTLTLRLLPGGKTVTLNVKEYDEMSVEFSGDMTQFYTAQERTATLSGYSGAVRYSADLGNVLRRNTLEDADGWIGDWNDAQRVDGNSLTVYGCYGNGDAFHMKFKPEDSFNDGEDEIDLSVMVKDPYLLFDNPTSPVFLDVMGTWQSAHALYYTSTSPDSSYLLPITSFNKTLYYRLLDYNYQFGLNPTEAEKTAFEATIGVLKDDRMVTTGYYRSYQLCRKALYSSYSPGCIEAVEKGSPVEYELRAVSLNGIVSENSRSLLLYPFLDGTFSANFQESYHDYSLINTEKLDYPYSSYTTSYTSGGTEHFYMFSAADPYFSMKAVPVEFGSDGYSEGVSQSIELSLTDVYPTGQIKVSFVDGDGVRHSVGKHEIRASVKNKRSGEVMTAVIGSFKVYVDFVVGLDLEMEYQNESQAQFHAWTVMMSDVDKTSCGTWFASFGVSADDAEDQTITYDVWDKTVGDRVKIGSGTKVQCGPTFARHDEPFNDLYTITLYKDSGYTGSLFDSIDAAGYMECFGGQIWLRDTAGDPKKTVNVIVSGMKDDAAGGVGYYTFHRLKDLCSASKGWVQLYNAL